jgi:hypothetical protein
VEAKVVIGGPAPTEVQRIVKQRELSLEKYRAWRKKKLKILEEADKRLERAIKAYLKS